MIVSIRHRGLRRLYELDDRSKVVPWLVERAEEVLGMLDVAKRSRDMDLPGYRLHRLKGDLRGYWSVTLSANWRIIFRLEEENAYDIDLVDYH